MVTLVRLRVISLAWIARELLMFVLRGPAQ